MFCGAVCNCFLFDYSIRLVSNNWAYFLSMLFVGAYMIINRRNSLSDFECIENCYVPDILTRKLFARYF